MPDHPAFVSFRPLSLADDDCLLYPVLMSYMYRGRLNSGAYTQPFSGVGIAFTPLGSVPDCTGLILHESGYLPENANWNFPSVFSPFWRIFHNAAPGHCVISGESKVELNPESLIVVPPHRMIHCLGKNPVPSFWLHFSFDRKPNPDQPMPIRLSVRPTELCIIGDIADLISSNETWEPTESILRHSLALLHIILSRPELTWQPPPTPQLARVRQHIERQFNQPLRNQELARIAGMALTTFIPAFHAAFGSTPSRYVTEIRVRETARMLLQTSLSIDEIADRTGFPSRAYLSRVFHKITGQSPAAFRKRGIPGVPS